MLYYCPEHSYHSRMHFLQRLAHAFAKHWDVTYVDVDRVAWRTRRYQMRSVSSPAPIRHFSAVRLPGLRHVSVEAKSAQFEMLQTLAYLGIRRIRPEILWCFSTRALPIVRALKDQVDAVVYWTGDEVLDPQEPELLREVTHVFALSEFAAEQKRRLTDASKVHVMPMAVDPTPYLSAKMRARVPPDLAAIPRPRVGYGGLVNRRLNWDLLLEAARLRPAYQFVFVGPMADGVGQAVVPRKLPNMHFLGHRDEPDSLDYLAAMDVGALPYAMNPFNLGSNPTKVYEYLAAGLPVVASPLPSIAHLSQQVHMAADTATFCRELDAAVQESEVPSLLAMRYATANRHSYENLVDRVVTILTARKGDGLQ